MATITLRAVKGSPLTNAEVDANFTNLNTELAGKSSSGTNADISSLTGITGGISSPDFVQFDTLATVTPAVGQVNWNDTDGTLEFGLKGGNVTLQIGQKQVLRATNATGATLINGAAVYITGSTGSHVNVVKAQANAEVTSSKTIGVVTEDIANNQSGFVTTSGLVRGLNTSALTEGGAVWLSATSAGGMTSTRPSPPNHAVLLGWCVKSHASVGVIYVHVLNGYELDELHNVLLTSSANNDVLSYDSASGLWKNRALATVANTGSYSDLSGKPTNVSSFTNDSGYITASSVAAGYQPLDGDLTAIAGIAGTSGLLKKTAANTWTLDTSSYLTGNQSISISGDASGSGSTSITLTLATVNSNVGTFNNVTVNAKGLVTAASNVSYQPLDADLTAIAGIAATSGLLKKTAADTWSLDTSTYLTGNQSITLSGDASGSGTTAITVTLANSGVTAGTYNSVTVNTKGLVTAASNVSYQPLDADLTAIAGLAGTSGLLKKTAADTWSLDTSSYITGNQSISVSGDATGSGTTSIALTLANSGVTAGTYTKVTVDAKGRVTTGASLASADLPTYTGTITSSQVTTALGYTPYNSSNPSGYITSAALTPYAPLASPSFTGTANFTAVKSVVTAVAASAVDCATGNYFTKTATGALSWTVSNVPATGVFSFILELTNGGTGTQTWFTGIKWPGGTAPTLTAAGVDLLGFVTDDGGTTWRGVQLMKDSK